MRRAASVLNLTTQLIPRLFGYIENGNPRAFAGEAPRGRGAHPPGPSGDQYCLAHESGDGHEEQYALCARHPRTVGQFTPASSEFILEAARTHLRGRVRRGTPLSSPSLVRDFLTVNLGDRNCEYFCLLLLDSRHRFLKFVELFRRTIDGASVHPREVVKTVLDARASAVLLVHNHASQICEPSAADELITKRLRAALEVVDVRVLDHLIVGGAELMSFAEAGLL